MEREDSRNSWRCTRCGVAFWLTDDIVEIHNGNESAIINNVHQKGDDSKICIGPLVYDPYACLEKYLSV